MQEAAFLWRRRCGLPDDGPRPAPVPLTHDARLHHPGTVPHESRAAAVCNIQTQTLRDMPGATGEGVRSRAVVQTGRRAHAACRTVHWESEVSGLACGGEVQNCGSHNPAVNPLRTRSCSYLEPAAERLRLLGARVDSPAQRELGYQRHRDRNRGGRAHRARGPPSAEFTGRLAALSAAARGGCRPLREAVAARGGGWPLGEGARAARLLGFDVPPPDLVELGGRLLRRDHVRLR